jgi:RNA polymerase sigma-70 factor (ECF subfamily)
MEEQEIHLFDRLRERDREAFRYLYERYYTRMILFAESYLYDEEEARDMVQDLFFYLWQNAPSLRVTLSVKAYLFASLRNRCLNALRARKIRDTRDDKLLEAQLYSGTEEVTLDEEVQRRLQAALDALPARCREIFLLKVVEGKKNSEIARQLDLAEATVKTQVQRAYKMLRQRMIPILALLDFLLDR